MSHPSAIHNIAVCDWLECSLSIWCATCVEEDKLRWNLHEEVHVVTCLATNGDINGTVPCRGRTRDDEIRLDLRATRRRAVYSDAATSGDGYISANGTEASSIQSDGC